MTEERQILFEKYIQGKLEANELVTFNDQLRSDASFKEEFELYKVMEGFVEEKVKNEGALGVLQKVHQVEIKKEAVNAKLTPLKSFIIFFIVLATVFAYLKLSKSSKQNAPLAMTYVDPNWPQERGKTNDILANAASLALNNKTTEAISILKKSSLSDFDKAYWISETFAKSNQFDSVIIYLPKQSLGILRDRINYLEILAQSRLEHTAIVQQLIKELPEDTDTFYMKIYKSNKK